MNDSCNPFNFNVLDDSLAVLIIHVVSQMYRKKVIGFGSQVLPHHCHRVTRWNKKVFTVLEGKCIFKTHKETLA